MDHSYSIIKNHKMSHLDHSQDKPGLGPVLNQVSTAASSRTRQLARGWNRESHSDGDMDKPKKKEGVNKQVLQLEIRVQWQELREAEVGVAM